MPRLIPDNPAFESDAERVVWEALRDQLPSHAVLMANVKFTDSSGDHEADLIVAWPEVGFTVIEVKGGLVAMTPTGGWTQSDQSGSREIDPVDQAQRTRHALRVYVTSRWSQGSPRLNWMVAFPYTDLKPGFQHPKVSRDLIVDRVDLATIADKVRTAHQGNFKGPMAPDVTAVGLFAHHITGRFSEEQRDWALERDDRGEQVRRLTEDQFRTLDLLRHAHRFSVLGPAGSGKTFIALEQARRMTASGKRVALLCYSRGLARFLARTTQTWPSHEQPAYVGTFHALAVRWGVERPDGVDQNWWDNTCPVLMQEAGATLTVDAKFDAVVIDEAQDFGAVWWPALLTGLRDRDRGGVFAFGDADQGVFGRDGAEALHLTPITLDTNIRNAAPIARAAGLLASETPRHLGIDGPPIKFLECTSEDAITFADDQIDPLIDAGWGHQDIVLLTTGSRHPEHRNRVEKSGKDAYWDSFWDNSDVFYGHALGFKGLERPVVVLALNGWRQPERAREMLYVALSRARDLLIICGDRADLRSVGGDALANHILNP